MSKIMPNSLRNCVRRHIDSAGRIARAQVQRPTDGVLNTLAATPA
jgi:hypothetical protein